MPETGSRLQGPAQLCTTASLGSYKGLCFGQRLIEYRHREVDVFALDGQRRRDAPYRAALGTTAYVHAETQLQTSFGGERAQFVMRLSRLTVLDQLDAAQEAHTPQVVDLFVALLQRFEARGEIVAHLAASRQKVLALDRVEHGETDHRWQRIGYVRRIETKAAPMTRLFDCVGGDHARKRHPAAQRFRDRHDVRRHVDVRRSKPVTEAAEGGLGFVENQQHPAFMRFLLQNVEITFRRNDDAAG